MCAPAYSSSPQTARPVLCGSAPGRKFFRYAGSCARNRRRSNRVRVVERHQLAAGIRDEPGLLHSVAASRPRGQAGLRRRRASDRAAGRRPRGAHGRQAADTDCELRVSAGRRSSPSTFPKASAGLPWPLRRFRNDAADSWLCRSVCEATGMRRNSSNTERGECVEDALLAFSQHGCFESSGMPTDLRRYLEASPSSVRQPW